MRVVLTVLAACAVAGCGPADPDSGLEAASAGGADGSPPCATTALPITGLCADAHPARFLAIDTSLDTFARGCAWRTQELLIAPEEALVFRAQDCTGEMWDRTVYTWVGNYVKARPEPVPEDQAVFALQVFNVADGQTAEDVALRTLANAPEDQRGRCSIEPLNTVKVQGRAFELAPNDNLTQEMHILHPNEPWEACGPNGVAMDGTQFWEGRRTHALFHITGQDQPGWDPASFTFYRKDPGGTWYKAS
jgi:hypothetical protein